MRRRVVVAFVATLVFVPTAPAAVGDADVAALQVGLRERGLYRGTIDGLNGPLTEHGLRRLAAVTEPIDQARTALGEYGRYTLGQRALRPGLRGWDVAAFQFLLSWQGFPSGPMNGSYTARTAAAVRQFQSSVGLRVDGVVGPLTLSAVRRPLPRAPLRLAAPATLPPSGFFGPRDNRFHTGIDYATTVGTGVRAASAGRVSFAGWHAGGYGFLVTVDHGAGVQTMYAHLARIAVRIGQAVPHGAVVGRSGASGLSSGPHLHFEVRVRDAAVDPLPALR
jgi:murein DD-endopeptidase MepM/ murein hydrolase activator NlpD